MPCAAVVGLRLAQAYLHDPFGNFIELNQPE
jgi:uncharacterized protein YggU (UPF0235/DUF167 family)